MSISLKNNAGTFSTNLNHSNPTENVNIALPTTSGTMAKVEDKLVSGTAYTFTGTETFKDFTGIPSWAKRITVMFIGVSTNGASNIQVQLGDSGGIENTSYLSGASSIGSAVISANSTTGLLIGNNTNASHVRNGNATLLYSGSNSWSLSSVIGLSNTGETGIGGGSKSISATLDRIRITTVNGTDTFDAGTVNIMWE